MSTSSEKQKVLDYLKHDREYMSGFHLYNSLQGKNMALVQSLNRQGNTRESKESLLYEMAKTVGINERQLQAIVNKKVEPKKVTSIVYEKDDDEDGGGNKELKPISELTLKEKETIAKAEKGRSLREDYPFLGKKETPDALKALVADMLTAYHEYKEKHNQLVVEDQSLEDYKKLVLETLHAYLEDNKIRKELDYYLKHGKVLGEHPKMKRDLEIEKLKEMSGVRLEKERTNVATYLSKVKAKLKTDPTKETWLEAKANHEWKLSVITKLSRDK